MVKLKFMDHGWVTVSIRVRVSSKVCVRFPISSAQTWSESTFNDSESDSGRLFDSESDSIQFGYDSDSSNISISDSDSNFQLLI